MSQPSVCDLRDHRTELIGLCFLSAFIPRALPSSWLCLHRFTSHFERSVITGYAYLCAEE